MLRTFEALKDKCDIENMVDVLWRLVSSSKISALDAVYPKERARPKMMANQDLTRSPHLPECWVFGQALCKVRSSVFNVGYKPDVDTPFAHVIPLLRHAHLSDGIECELKHRGSPALLHGVFPGLLNALPNARCQLPVDVQRTQGCPRLLSAGRQRRPGLG